MAGIKSWIPDIKTYEQGVTWDEMDAYRTITVQPAINVRWWASAGTAGTASAIAMVMLNRLPDWPRNINFILAGTGVGMAGSLDANGKDQFGNTVTETIGFGSADNGGTQVGTKVFAALDSGTLRYGTAVGNGTPQIGFVPGTNCLLGLPDKINGTTDVVQLGFSVGTGAVTYGGGTIAAFVNSPMHAIRPALALDGTAEVKAWYVSRYDATVLGTVANLVQVT
ncbi:MAG: hypothetical protein AAB922_04615 [Patescibacteria group bacterium]